MAISSANVVEKGIKALFAEGIAAAKTPIFEQTFNLVDSVSNEEIIYISGGLPGFVEWEGEHKADDFQDYKYAIDNKHWIRQIPVNRDKLEDSKEYLSATIQTKVQGLSSDYNIFYLDHALSISF